MQGGWIIQRTIVTTRHSVIVVIIADIATGVIILIIIVLLILLMEQINVSMRLRRKLRRLEVVLWKWLSFNHRRCCNLIEIWIQYIAAFTKRYGTICRHWISLTGRSWWYSVKMFLKKSLINYSYHFSH